MPLYMDRHDIEPGTPPHKVAEAHHADLMLQEKYACKAITYWFDEERCAAFCLIEAPNRKAVRKMHEEAHGLIPYQIIEVDEDLVQAFLGRIKDPDSTDVIKESAFRVIMFTDLKDSTKMTERYGDAEAMDLIRRHNNIIRGTIAIFGGKEIKHTGDGFMLSFTSASKAAECAIQIQNAFEQINEEKRHHPLEVRMGLSAGEPVNESGDLYGASIQQAARICDYANPGQILASSVISDLCLGKNIKFESKGEVNFKGFDRDTRICEIIWHSQ